MQIQLFDTTLRDGTQSEGLSLSVEDKLRIARVLDGFGIQYIEGGYPGSNPKDIEFFRRARGELRLKHAKLTAFGSTRKAHTPAAEDTNLRALVESGTPVVCIYGKSWPLHVTHVLQTTLDENLAMIRDSVAFLKSEGKEVIYDGEHFFDGFRADREYALAAFKAAADAGADWLVLCDTNGGSLPSFITDVVRAVRAHLPGTPHRHPQPQRRRHGRGQRAGGGGSRRHPGAGHHERLGRALRERQPDLHHPRAAAEDGAHLRPRGEPGPADRALPHRQRDRQHPPAGPRALRRRRAPSPTRAAPTWPRWRS